MSRPKTLAQANNDIETLRPIIEAHGPKGEELRHLPEEIAEAFVERDIYRLLLPVELGGHGFDPNQHFDLITEVARLDGSVGWLYWLGGSAATISGRAPDEFTRSFFSSPRCQMAASAMPGGKAVPADGGYIVSGRWGWASGIKHARVVAGNCLVMGGEKPTSGPQGGPLVIMALFPIEQVEVLDVWRTGGMRGTGSTDFAVSDLFVPKKRVMKMGAPRHPHPIYRLPTSHFGFGIAAVAVGIGLSTVDALEALARSKKLPPPRGSLADQHSVQYAVGKARALVEAAHITSRDAGVRVWNEVCENGEASMGARARLRRALIHAVDSCTEAVSLCYREAGGSAVFESAPFERALRDIHAIGGHAVVQRAMMQDAGRCALGMKALSPLF